MDPKFLEPYNPQETESRIYQAWEESGFFNPDTLPEGEGMKEGVKRAPFTVMMPPPNATGILHIGHALFLTIQDVMIRFRRMRGYASLWLPGTDHAAISTQSVVEKKIYKEEGKNRHDIGRDEMMRRIASFVEETRGTIRNQIRLMGASCDWSREAFTLDEERNRAVRKIFKDMYDAGLIYRGHRIVNWDPKGQTTISDDEIVYEKRSAKLYTFRYATDFPIPIATTRPETKVGDVAVAVHPDDARYKAFIGKEYDLTFCDVPLHITVITDTSIDPTFGTGALGVTPAHSQVDWEMGEKHNLPHPQVINEFAKMEVPQSRVHGKKTTEARDMIVEWLRDEKLLISEEDIDQNISTAERTGGIIEPLPKLQWFVDVNRPIKDRGNKSLKELMMEPVKDGRITILPDHFNKTYFHWIENLRDWCISRQIWYGHRVPVWYRGEEVTVGEAPSDEGWTQDEDTLDTWFSSGSWTFSTLGWPEETRDLSRFHPTDVLETGHDILFFWVARMILMTQFALGTVPFKLVYLHGLVRDAKGRKFSKSLGNGIDPAEMVEKFGADALRMALLIGNTPGTDTRMSEDKIKAYKHFANKIWNIARFVLSNSLTEPSRVALMESDELLLRECDELTEDVTKDMEEYRLYMAAEKLYHYTWHRFADVILEESKPLLYGTDEAAKISRAAVLMLLLEKTLRLLHPFMPFVTEEVWNALPMRKQPLMISAWQTTTHANT